MSVLLTTSSSCCFFVKPSTGIAKSIWIAGRFAALASALLLALTLAWPEAVQAHRVNIFAWTEGPQVVTEAGFNGGNKVREGAITVFDAATGAKLLEGRTDNSGIFRFDIPAEGKAHGLRIRINAGEGHQNEWLMEASELASTTESTAAGAANSATAAAPAANTVSQTPQAVTATVSSTASGPVGAGASSTPNALCATPENVRDIVNAALDVKLGPIRRELAEMREAKPGPAEIFGGIGWLVGLAGVALYFKGRRG